MSERRNRILYLLLGLAIGCMITSFVTGHAHDMKAQAAETISCKAVVTKITESAIKTIDFRAIKNAFLNGEIKMIEM